MLILQKLFACAFCFFSVCVYGFPDKNVRWTAGMAEKGVELCASPGGWHPCDCLHEVDSHTRIDEVKNKDGSRKAVINFPNGTSKDLEQCPYSPLPPKVEREVPSQRSDNLCQLGWAHATPMEAFYQHSRDIANYTATYTVPEAPSRIASEILYYWIGLQDLDSTENPVIQPVLSWIKGSDPNNWYFESWNCCPAGHKLKATSVPISGVGASVFGRMYRDTNGLYTISSEDSAGKNSVLYSNDTLSGIVRTWDWVEIVLETYGVESCRDYSAGGQARFLDMKLIDIDGQSVTLSWTLNPYINGEYLNASAAAQFQACCGGTFKLDWPNAAIHQNGYSSGSVVV